MHVISGICKGQSGRAALKASLALQINASHKIGFIANQSPTPSSTSKHIAVFSVDDRLEFLSPYEAVSNSARDHELTTLTRWHMASAVLTPTSSNGS
jgi:hypothetical protein